MTTREHKTKNPLNVLQDIKALKNYFEFIRQAAHDIRSPLNVIELLAGEIGQHADDEIREAFFDSIKRIKKLADEILIQYQIGCQFEYDKPSHVTKKEFADLILKIVRENKFMLQKTLINMETDIDLSDFENFSLRICPFQFCRVLTNLINNAIEALSESGNIKISAKKQGNNLLISIEDNGPGISPEIINSLMKDGATYGKKDGHGLGLYHAKKTIQSWKGKIKIASSIGMGTKIKILLPVISEN